MQRFSLCVAKIEMLFVKDGEVSDGGLGTGFFYKHGSGTFLVTNWHNVTGVNPITGAAIHSQGLLPNTLRVHYKQWAANRTVVRSMPVEIPLFVEDAPVWFEHSTRRNVDVVAIPIDTDRLESFANEHINLVDQEKKLTPYAGMDCFILGFPEGLTGAANTPIWKRGSIAAEP